jgi:hypothetical protein
MATTRKPTAKRPRVKARANAVSTATTRKPAAKSARPRATSVSAAAPRTEATGVSVEEAWRGVDRVARAIWAAHYSEVAPPESLADLVTSLRDEEIVPTNEANMMHTIRSLRNLVVHESLEAGEHETTVAGAAWQIVKRWALRHEPGAAKAAGLR